MIDIRDYAHVSIINLKYKQYSINLTYQRSKRNDSITGFDL